MSASICETVNIAFISGSLLILLTCIHLCVYIYISVHDSVNGLHTKPVFSRRREFLIVITRVFAGNFKAVSV